jgi:hypothetical protein
MKNTDYVPGMESKFLIWSENYVNALVANAERWGIPQNTLTGLNALHTTFKEKYALAENPATRTKIAVQAKNDAKKAFIANIRRVYRSFVLYNENVTNDDRDLLQVPIHDTTATPATAPTTAPAGTINTAVHLRHTIKVVDTAELSKRGGLPAGVHGFETWRKTGGEIPVNNNDFAYLNFSSTSTLTVDYPLEDAGKTVWYRFRWATNTNQHGPWSEIVSAIIP